MTSISQEGVTGIYYFMEEPRVMVEHEECSCLKAFAKKYDPRVSDSSQVLHPRDQEPLLLESPLKARVMTTDEMIEHIPCGAASKEVYASMDCGDMCITDKDTSS
jgi:hypothetical protein